MLRQNDDQTILTKLSKAKTKITGGRNDVKVYENKISNSLKNPPTPPCGEFRKRPQTVTLTLLPTIPLPPSYSAPSQGLFKARRRAG